MKGLVGPSICKCITYSRLLITRRKRGSAGICAEYRALRLTPYACILLVSINVWISRVFICNSRICSISHCTNENRTITGSPAALSHVNGVRRRPSSANTWNFNRWPKSQFLYQLISNLAWVITLERSLILPNLVRVRWAVKTPRGGNIYGSCNLIFFSFFLFFNRATAHTSEPIFAHNDIAQKTRSGVRKTLLGMRNV